MKGHEDHHRTPECRMDDGGGGSSCITGLTAQGVARQGSSAGEQLYRGCCAVCHGEKGNSRGVAAPSMGSWKKMKYYEVLCMFKPLSP